MAKAYLGLGSNMGDKKQYIDDAVILLRKHEKICIKRVSSYYETPPVGYVEQDVFLNIVIEIDTGLDPYELLKYCNEIEQTLKRERIIRWGPRTIDIDILLYENYISDEEKLTIPHPRMTERSFVILPLYEIAPDIIIKGKNIKDILENLDIEDIKKLP